MPWFLTEYQPNWKASPRSSRVKVGNFGANLWAADHKHAGRVAKRRGMGERVISGGSSSRPYFPASRICDRYEQERTPKHFRDACHALSYLGMVALASRAATAPEVLGDEGILHDFIHPRSGRDHYSDLRKKIVAIERRVPGYLP